MTNEDFINALLKVPAIEKNKQGLHYFGKPIIDFEGNFWYSFTKDLDNGKHWDNHKYKWCDMPEKLQNEFIALTYTFFNYEPTSDKIYIKGGLSDITKYKLTDVLFYTLDEPFSLDSLETMADQELHDLADKIKMTEYTGEYIQHGVMALILVQNEILRRKYNEHI